MVGAISEPARVLPAACTAAAAPTRSSAAGRCRRRFSSVNTSATGPEAIRSTLSNTTSSKYSRTESRSWCTATTVLPAVTHVVQELDDRPLGDGVDPDERLVHQVEVGLLRQGTGQEHPLLLATGSWLICRSAKSAIPSLSRHSSGDLAIALARPPEPADLAIPAHRHHIERIGREIPIHRTSLGNVGDLLAHPCRGCPRTRTVPAAVGTRPSIALSSVLFPAPFGPTIAVANPGADLDINIPQHGRLVIGDGQVMNLDIAGSFLLIGTLSLAITIHSLPAGRSQWRFDVVLEHARDMCPSGVSLSRPVRRSRAAPRSRPPSPGRGPPPGPPRSCAGNAGFHEDRRDLSLDQHVGDSLHVPDTGLGRGTDALQANDLDVVRPAEVAERVVGGHQHPLLVGNRAESTVAQS